MEDVLVGLRRDDPALPAMGVVELAIVARASDSTIGRTLKKTVSRGTTMRQMKLIGLPQAQNCSNYPASGATRWRVDRDLKLAARAVGDA
jgi:hypothetical protein